MIQTLPKKYYKSPQYQLAGSQKYEWQLLSIIFDKILMWISHALGPGLITVVERTLGASSFAGPCHAATYSTVLERSKLT